jgi:hypothetical protein
MQMILAGIRRERRIVTERRGGGGGEREGKLRESQRV